MKGIGKYVNDLTKELSEDMTGFECKGIMSNKMKTNQYLVKNNHLIHFNERTCRNCSAQKEIIAMMVYEAVCTLSCKNA